MWRKKRSQSQVNVVWKKEFKIECLFNHTLKRIPFQRCPEIKYSLPLGFERSWINVCQSPKRMRSVLKKSRLWLYLYLFNHTLNAFSITHWKIRKFPRSESMGGNDGPSENWKGKREYKCRWTMMINIFAKKRIWYLETCKNFAKNDVTKFFIKLFSIYNERAYINRLFKEGFGFHEKIKTEERVYKGNRTV